MGTASDYGAPDNSLFYSLLDNARLIALLAVLVTELVVLGVIQ